ncbi:Protein of unknown function [Pseudomonas syringae]|nr:Protein of unknown function [Pseudomonas syringae]
MTSSVDLRPIIEAAFLPMTCVCDFAPRGSMKIRISDPATEAEEFTVTGIDTTALVTCSGQLIPDTTLRFFSY